MLIILDLDHTLFNASALKKDLFKSLEGLEVSQKFFKKVYQKLRKNHPYGHQLFLKALFKKKQIDQKKAKAELKKFDNRLGRYLYGDSLWFLKKLKKDRAKLILLTYGEREFQKAKLRKVKIKSFFDKILITDKNKLPLIPRLIKNKKGKIIFINDHKEENRQIAKNFKDITILEKSNLSLKQIYQHIKALK